MSRPSRGRRDWNLHRGRREKDVVRGDLGGGLCQNFQQTGHCRFGTKCIYSHDSNSNLSDKLPRTGPRERPQGTPEQQEARSSYYAWKRLIKSAPRVNDIGTIRMLWTGALGILDGDDCEWKQMLPRDLENADHFGRQHMQSLLTMETHLSGHATFVDLARPFVLVISHPAILDCLAVDTAVGNLYNFMSGSNGSRAVRFFQNLSTNLVEQHLESTILDSATSSEKLLKGTVMALRELLRREMRVAFHDDLPELLNSVENAAQIALDDQKSAAALFVFSSIKEIRKMVARATRLLQEDEEPIVEGVSTTVVTSTYPQEIILPRDRHDNDKTDFTKIKILPTEEEIRSDHPDFLPSMELDQPHFLTDRAERHLDTLFRLLRHDVFGELKEVLGRLMFALDTDPLVLDNPNINLGNVRAYTIAKAHVTYVAFDQRRGLEAHIAFPEPNLLRKKSVSERCRWWQDSKRLEEGTLLCFISVGGGRTSLLFFVVSEKCTDARKEYSLVSTNHQATIVAKPATRQQLDLEQLTSLSCWNTRGMLLELPGVMLATFVPILENIQDMQRASRLLFDQWILPDPTSASCGTLEVLGIPPPVYARHPGFSFSLQSILKDVGNNLTVSSTASVNDSAFFGKLEAQSGLDGGQCRALVAALTREYAFIQGPPGTGKSYLGVHLMKVLLDAKAQASIGPVVVVCYTNHALDQFLEHLIEDGVEKVIRIGGQSKSAVLEGKNLRIVSQGMAKTKSEGYLLATKYRAIEDLVASAKSVLKLLHGVQKSPSWTNLKPHLMLKHWSIFTQFSRIDRDGFKTVGPDPFDIWAKDIIPARKRQILSPSSSPEDTKPILARAKKNVNSVLFHERCQLVEFWMEELRKDKTDELYELVEEANTLRQQLSNVHDEVDRRVLQTADVIGVTTTGLAKRISVLQRVKCKIVICEEAGEVMEPHMVSALLPSVEHFIQIGDHQQLRPQINNFKLSLESQEGKSYQLDRSQFERLSARQPGKAPFPVAQLNVQRRMRPEISRLIKETIYPNLVDHESIRSLPDVVGMRKNVFWLDHENEEEVKQGDKHQKSHSNVWEVDMTHALVRHIVRQGAYKSSEIAVLTPYGGQLQKLRAKMRSEFEVVLSERDQETLAKEGFVLEESTSGEENLADQSGSYRRPLEKKKLSELLRIATVDNFQGEEAKVVIISLVRSNNAQKVGFLKTTNRINVLLSRAKHGMYLIGNKDTYSNVPMWNKILDMLQETDSVGKALGLCCPRHPGTEILVTNSDDFGRLSPEGGCQLACDRRLDACGHRCQAKCHSEGMHQVFACPLPCQRLQKPCNHSCQKETCGEDCGLCMVKLDNIQLPCGHTKDNVACHLTQNLAQVRCNIIVQKQVPECKHMVQVECCRDVATTHFRCPVACGTIFGCGHPCSGTCGRCNTKDINNQPIINHLICRKVCGRPSGTCNHNCKRPCHSGNDCGPCLSRCEVRCAHSRCRLECHEPCAPCIEKCTWSCEHSSGCSMPCAALCDRLPCNQRCSSKLACGHQCPSICGEICPEGYCQTCSNRTDARVDFLEMKSYGEIDLDETPIVVLGCGHFFTAESLDGHIGMAEVYIQDANGRFTGLRDVSAVLARSIPRCPDCQGIIRQYATQRFNRVINRAVIDEMSKRFLVNGKRELQGIDQEVAQLDRSLEESRKKITQSIRQAGEHVTRQLTYAKQMQVTKELKDRYQQCRKLENYVQEFRKKVADKHQPVQKLYEATVHAARRQSVDQMMRDLSLASCVPVVERDQRVNMGGHAAQLKVESISLADRLSIVQILRSMPTGASIQMPGGAPDQMVKPFFKSCRSFVTACDAQDLPKLGVEACLYYATIAQLYRTFGVATGTDISKTSEYVKTAQELLRQAQELCSKSFQNANTLGEAVQASIKQLGKESYEEVTAEEIAAIKAAMVGGPRGIATHSGHWYNCQNGHPFAIGECGMPMELARCPECGEPIGGQSHQAVAGVTRASNMES